MRLGVAGKPGAQLVGGNRIAGACRPAVRASPTISVAIASKSWR